MMPALKALILMLLLHGVPEAAAQAKKRLGPDALASRFIIRDVSLPNIARILPFRGMDSKCPSPGVDTFFKAKTSSYSVDLVSPVSGSVAAIQYCVVGGKADHYEISLELRHGAKLVFSLEPSAGFLCSQGKPGFDNGFYQQYIRVVEGQKVSSGDVIARLYRPKISHGDSRIRFAVENGENLVCPELFDEATSARYYRYFPEKSCEGTAYPKTWCFKPGPTEELFGP